MWAFSVLVGSPFFPGSFSKQLWEMLSSLYNDKIGAQRAKMLFFSRKLMGRDPLNIPLYLGAVALPSEKLIT